METLLAFLILWISNDFKQDVEAASRDLDKEGIYVQDRP